jgi:hypothetical protein
MAILLQLPLDYTLLNLQRIAIQNTKMNLNVKGPYLAHQLSDCFTLIISSNVIA